MRQASYRKDLYAIRALPPRNSLISCPMERAWCFSSCWGCDEAQNATEHSVLPLVLYDTMKQSFRQPLAWTVHQQWEHTLWQYSHHQQWVWLCDGALRCVFLPWRPLCHTRGRPVFPPDWHNGWMPYQGCHECHVTTAKHEKYSNVLAVRPIMVHELSVRSMLASCNTQSSIQTDIKG